MSPPAGGRSLRRRVGQAFAAVLIVFLVLLATVIGALVVFIRKGDDLVERWQPAVTTSQRLLADLVNQEIGVRGYALGKRSEFLQPYYAGRAEQNKDETRLRGLIANVPELQPDFAAFDASVTSWRTHVATPTIVRVRRSDSTAFAIAYSGQAKASFDKIRARAAAIFDDLLAGQQAAGRARARALAFVWITVGITTGLITITGYIIWRGVRRSVLDPVESLAAQTRQVVGGDLRRGIVATGPPEIARLGTDVDEMRARIVDELAQVDRARAELVARSENLARSNADLEQFAYVASHDLSEPLRKVANFCQLLERQYGPQLDDKARQYIYFAVDGAKRMQILIGDLLAFSRVGRSAEQFDPVDTGVALSRAMANLDQRISAADAVIVRGSMPTVRGDQTLLTALFQNLVGNAIKYRGEDPPRVEISSARRDDGWLFTVSDNGIGIEYKYAERIFAIFQRLHLRDEYGGTGIGLALCRKIVEFHDGRIWLARGGPPGATFQFTVPDTEPVPGDRQA